MVSEIGNGIVCREKIHKQCSEVLGSLQVFFNHWGQRCQCYLGSVVLGFAWAIPSDAHKPHGDHIVQGFTWEPAHCKI